MVHVKVLMSTYNGEKYIREQLDSIFSQENVEVSVLVRDDGSTDRTLDILTSYKENKNLEFYKGINLGYRASFLNLLSKASDNIQYYAFADQDDVWLPDKLSVAVEEIKELKENKGIPVLYASAVQKVDVDLVPLNMVVYDKKCLSVEREIAHHRLPGCTFVFNNCLFNVVKNAWSKEMKRCSHDELLTIMCLLSGGKLFLDQDSYILFRRHDGNESNDGKSVLQKIKKELKFFSTRNEEKSMYARELLRVFYKYIVDEEMKKKLSRYAFYKSSWKKTILLAFGKNIDSGIWWYDCYLRLLILIHKF